MDKAAIHFYESVANKRGRQEVWGPHCNIHEKHYDRQEKMKTHEGKAAALPITAIEAILVRPPSGD